jgi:putative ABC transport system substrate-binding protein
MLRLVDGYRKIATVLNRQAVEAMMVARAAQQVVLAVALFAMPVVSLAQPSPKIGLLSIGTDPIKPNPVWVQFLKQLGELGYVEGRNISIERGFAGGQQERLAGLVADLAGRQVDVVVATGDVENVAAKRGLATTPIVMMLVQDPVGNGLVASLARPGGNVTGLTTLAPELYSKRLELLRDALPGVTRAGVLVNPTNAGSVAGANGMDDAARILGLQLRRLEVRGPQGLAEAFASLTHQRLPALVVVTDGVTFNQRARIADLAIQKRVPLMCEVREFVVAGCLMAYGPSYGDLARRAAFYVDRILKGAKPADLPVEQPTRFELVINKTTARALGLTIPVSLLLRADEVIE